MPQLQSQDSNATPLYGAGQIQENIPFQERMARLFAPHEYVRIKNIDNAVLQWQYLPAHAEDIQSTPDGIQRHISRGTPERWYVNPGAEEVLIGASAYLALDAMFKNVMAKKSLKRAGIDLDKGDAQAIYDEGGKHIPQNFNYSDAGAQEEFLHQAFVGKFNPDFSALDQTTTSEVETIRSMGDVQKEKDASRERTTAKA